LLIFSKTDLPPYIDSLSYVDRKGFKTKCPLYSVDLTGQPENISNTKNKIMLHVDFDKAVPNPSESGEEIIHYVVTVSNCTLHYEPSKNRITLIN